MNVIKLPYNHLSYDLDWYVLEMSKIVVDFKIHNNSLNVILNNKSIPKQSKHNILFLVYNMFLSNDFESPLKPEFGGMPTGGFEFFNKERYDYYGIYHAHISNEDSGVLIWYVTWPIGDYLIVNFRYHPHPSESGYNTIIKEIYKEEYGWNPTLNKFFDELEYLLKESSSIYKFDDYIKLISNT
jgi:hypothetical protein